MTMNGEALAVNKYYRTKDGHKVRILATDKRCENNYPVVGLLTTRDHTDREIEETLAWGVTGNFSHESHPLDLISTWYDPPIVDWTTMPAWAKYAGQNKDGTWRWHATRPEGLYNEWMSYGGGTIPPEYVPTYFGPWQNSLVERPAEAD